jgi:hypothetical protein
MRTSVPPFRGVSVQVTSVVSALSYSVPSPQR